MEEYADASQDGHRSTARQSCDACRTKKRKCEFAQVTRSPRSEEQSWSCIRCDKLNVACTFLLPCKVRGPRKRNPAPAVVDPDAVSQPVHSPIGGPPPHSVFIWSPTSQASLDSYATDELCPRDTFRQLMGDYLELVYPLIPVVHRPSFQEDLRLNRDQSDSCFLAFVICLCAVTVGLLPSHFQHYRSSLRFQSRTEMITCCYEISQRLRGPQYFDEINLQKWATSYLLNIAFFQIGQQNLSRMLEVEAMQLARLLDIHRITEYEGLNHIEIQLRKKAFWLMFYGYVHGQLQNLRKERLTFIDGAILKNIKFEDLIPADADDEQILENEILPHHPLSLTTGFNIHSKVFWTSLSHSTEESTPSDVRSRLHSLKYMLDTIPQELRQWVTSASRSTKQIAAIRANLHVTQLWLQSILLDQLENQDVEWTEREDISRQLLHVLHSTPHESLEPNGLHLIYKVRDIAVALLTCPYESHSGPARRAAEYLREFTLILSKLDGSEVMNTLSLQSWVDTGRVSRNGW